jgi:hypothetical protein
LSRLNVMHAMVGGRAISLWLAVFAAVGCIPVDLIGLVEQHKRAKKQLATPNRPLDLAAWEPVALQPPQRRPGQLVTLKVRVYPDEEYRAANVRWQDRIRLLVSAASGYLEAGFGARLEIESMRPWKRQGAKDRTDQLLQALAAEDSGEGVDWVIGFVSPLGFVTTSIHAAGAPDHRTRGRSGRRS